jgi:hypothetical protein
MINQKTYPYTLHTNRELELMLTGIKPFAAFVVDRTPGFEKSDMLSDQDFDTHVASGVMSEHLRTVSTHRPDGTPIEIDRYFYALKGKEWRVEAYCLLLDLLQRGGWCPQLEWLEGKLLGYTDEQNAYHLSRAYPTNQAMAWATPSANYLDLLKPNN